MDIDRIKYWLNKLKPEHRDKALANMKELGIYWDPVEGDTLHKALQNAFEWSESEERSSYWEDIFDDIKKKKYFTQKYIWI